MVLAHLCPLNTIVLDARTAKGLTPGAVRVFLWQSLQEAAGRFIIGKNIGRRFAASDRRTSMEEWSTYTETYTVSDTDADINGWLKPAALLRYAGQLATAQSCSLGMDNAFFRSIQRAYLLGKQSLEFRRVPRKDEKLVLTTIPERSRRGANKRLTIVKDAAGEEVALVDSRWIVVDTSTNRIVRHPEELTERHWNEEVQGELPQTMPKARELASGGVCRASYSLCDINGHLNNTFYLDLACDVLPLEELRAHPVRRASVRYHREVPLGESMELLYGRAEGGWYVQGRRAEQTAFEVFCGF